MMREFHFQPFSYFHQVALYSLLKTGIDFTPVPMSYSEEVSDCYLTRDVVSAWTHVSLVNPKLPDKETFFIYTMEVYKNLLRVLPQIYSNDFDSPQSQNALVYLELRLVAYENEVSANHSQKRELIEVSLIPALFSILSCYSFHDYKALASLFHEQGTTGPFRRFKEIVQNYKMSHWDQFSPELIEKIGGHAKRAQNDWVNAKKN